MLIMSKVFVADDVINYYIRYRQKMLLGLFREIGRDRTKNWGTSGYPIYINYSGIICK